MTHFVDRNLSFETDEDKLSTFISQFGDIIYCRVVVDPGTDRSRGCMTFYLCHEIH